MLLGAGVAITAPVIATSLPLPVWTLVVAGGDAGPDGWQPLPD